MRTDSHGRTSRREPLYDPDIPTPTHAERARTMVAGLGTATLCTQSTEPKGFPYGSFVTASFDGADPIFLLSELAEHTRNLRQDARASVLFHESGAADPLAKPKAPEPEPAPVKKKPAVSLFGLDDDDDDFDDVMNAQIESERDS